MTAAFARPLPSTPAPRLALALVMLLGLGAGALHLCCLTGAPADPLMGMAICSGHAAS